MMPITIASSMGPFSPPATFHYLAISEVQWAQKILYLILCNHFPNAFEESPKLRKARMATPLFDDIGVMILHIRQSHQCRLGFWFLAMA
jgi:hypothetical protein